MRYLLTLLFSSFFAGAGLPALAQAKYDEGARFINGIQLLQDKDDPNAYYYVPKYPKLATNDDGSFQLLCTKYVGSNRETSGGLFHALLEFNLPADTIASIEKKLRQEFPSAKIVGQVKLSQPVGQNEGGDKPASFEVVSAILSNKEGKESFTRSVLMSGTAPFTPGSKAAVAALLSPQGATLLWNSLTGAASDVSVTVNGSYEAYVKGYNATVSADVSTVYTHFSKLTSFQEGFTKDQTRKIVDDLRKDNSLKIEVFDRSAGLGIKSNDMEALLKIITDKLIELMFDAKNGWAKDPQRETAVEAGQVAGRRERGYFWQVFGGADNTEYVSDNQYVLKNRKDIQVNTFYLNLSKATTIRVPFSSTGNIAGLYKELGNDPRYFSVVDMDDPAFQKRSVHFQVDAEAADGFHDLVNFVAVSFRKKYGAEGAENLQHLMFQTADVKEGRTMKELAYPRLGNNSADWSQYEYRVEWGLKGTSQVISLPAEKDKWLTSAQPVVPLVLPFRKATLEIDAARSLFRDSGIVSAVLTIAGMQNGKSRQLRQLVLRPGDAESVSKVVVFTDTDSPVVYTVKWYNSGGTCQDMIRSFDIQSGKTGFAMLTPPPSTRFY